MFPIRALALRMLRSSPMRSSAFALALVCVLASPAALPAQKEKVDTKKLAGQARAILKQYCQRCHGVEFQVEGFDVLDHKGLLATHEDGGTYVKPGQPSKGHLFRRFGTSMPPRKVHERPSPADKALL